MVCVGDFMSKSTILTLILSNLFSGMNPEKGIKCETLISIQEH